GRPPKAIAEAAGVGVGILSDANRAISNDLQGSTMFAVLLPSPGGGGSLAEAKRRRAGWGEGASRQTRASLKRRDRAISNDLQASTMTAPRGRSGGTAAARENNRNLQARVTTDASPMCRRS
ncbi:MAG TPA: hypothetical protein VGZ49_11445, partial [Xanthobacteraceae bacterium]|nr:hypothetical protein [Xanthobacteraceae bacterium]